MKTLAAHTRMPPRLRLGTPVRLAAIGADRWRVLDSTGRIIGHIDARSGPEGIRFRARRYHTGTRAFVEVGEFWSADDAVACLRQGR